MIQEFKIVAIEADLQHKSVSIRTSMDVDPETITSANIRIYDKSTRNDADYKYVIEGQLITLEFSEWPVPNTEYIISIQNLKNVLGDLLTSGVRRKLIFNSNLCSIVNILYPADNEVITDLKLNWAEKLADPSHDYVNSYFLEIATDTTFHNVVKETLVASNTEVNLTDLPDGQYFSRVRVQKDNEYGLWSEVITFIVGDEAKKPEPVFGEPEDVIYTQNINLVSTPGQGETPKSIIIEFDCQIDPESVKNILVMRRTI